MDKQKVIKWADALIDDYSSEQWANISEYSSDPEKYREDSELKCKRLREEIRRLVYCGDNK